MIWGNESVVLWNVSQKSGCLISPAISISSSLSRDERRSGCLRPGVEAQEQGRDGNPRRAPRKRGLFEGAFMSSAAFFFRSVLIYFYLSFGSLQTFVVEDEAPAAELKTTGVKSLDKKTLYNIKISHYRKSHTHKNVKDVEMKSRLV